jgi:hypothetical protein
MWMKLLFAPAGSRRVAIIVVTAALNIALIILLIHLQGFSLTTGKPQAPIVSVVEQPDAPLTISVEGTDVLNPLSPQIKYTIRNLSNKAVRAYTILEETVTSKGKGTGITITSLDNDGNPLQPMQTKPGSFDSLSLSDPLVSLTLSMDYVEFADGTAWGKDMQHTAEHLAGQREGRKQAFIKIREVFDKQGIGAVTELIRQEGAEIIGPPGGHSPNWEYGFRVGHNSILYHLKTAYQKGGLQKLAAELHMQSEGSERNR